MTDQGLMFGNKKIEPLGQKEFMGKTIQMIAVLALGFGTILIIGSLLASEGQWDLYILLNLLVMLAALIFTKINAGAIKGRLMDISGATPGKTKMLYFFGVFTNLCPLLYLGYLIHLIVAPSFWGFKKVLFTNLTFCFMTLGVVGFMFSSTPKTLKALKNPENVEASETKIYSAFQLDPWLSFVNKTIFDSSLLNSEENKAYSCQLPGLSDSIAFMRANKVIGEKNKAGEKLTTSEKQTFYKTLNLYFSGDLSCKDQPRRIDIHPINFAAPIYIFSRSMVRVIKEVVQIEIMKLKSKQFRRLMTEDRADDDDFQIFKGRICQSFLNSEDFEKFTEVQNSILLGGLIDSSENKPMDREIASALCN